MMVVGAASLLLLVLTTLIHYEALRGLSLALPRLPVPPRAKVLVLIIGACMAHLVEIALYAGAMSAFVHWGGAGGFGFAQPPEFSVLLYFSTETYTSLGYGDVVPHGALRLLAGTEALAGLLMIAWSGSHAFVAMERFWKGRTDSSQNTP
jgi:hypothetical protein